MTEIGGDTLRRARESKEQSRENRKLYFAIVFCVAAFAAGVALIAALIDL